MIYGHLYSRGADLITIRKKPGPLVILPSGECEQSDQQ